MKTKAEIATEYTLDERGIVRSPGKFESEPWFAVALWDASLDGDHDREDFDGDTLLVSFLIEADIKTMLGDAVPTERESRGYVTLHESDSGFVSWGFTTRDTLDGLEGSYDS